MSTKSARLQQIEKARAEVKACDRQYREERKVLMLALANAFRDLISEYPGSLREVARRMELSAAYLSDIQHGRRSVSEKVMAALNKLK